MRTRIALVALLASLVAPSLARGQISNLQVAQGPAGCIATNTCTNTLSNVKQLVYPAGCTLSTAVGSVNQAVLTCAGAGSGNTLQAAYEASAGASPSILLTGANGPVDVRGPAAGMGVLFRVRTTNPPDILSISDSGTSSWVAAGALNLTGNSNSTWQTAAGSSLTLTAGAASTWSTSSGALTLTSAAASTWSTSAGALTLNGTSGINLQAGGATLADIGVTAANTATLAAGVSLSGAAGAGALSLGSMTGATSLPTGNLSWAGSAAATGSLVSGGAFTITGGAASTWGTSTGTLTLNSGVANAGTNVGTIIRTVNALGGSTSILTIQNAATQVLRFTFDGSIAIAVGNGASWTILPDQQTTLSQSGTVTAMYGGKGANGSGATAGAAGGISGIEAGAGGDGPAGAAAGTGGNLVLNAGAAGANGGGGGANGGALTLDGGAATGAGTGGTITLGGTDASAIAYGNGTINHTWSGANFQFGQGTRENITATSAAAGGTPSLTAANANSANVGINIIPKGTGTLRNNGQVVPSIHTVTVQQAMEYGTAVLVGGTLTVTFGTAFGATPNCQCTDQTNEPAAAPKCAPTSTQLVINVGSSTDTIAYFCIGQR